MTKQAPETQGNVIDAMIEQLKKAIRELRETTNGLIELLEKLREKEKKDEN